MLKRPRCERVFYFSEFSLFLRHKMVFLLKFGLEPTDL